MKSTHWILLIVLVVLTAAAAYIGYRTWEKKPSEFAETDSERERAIADAFAPTEGGANLRDVSDDPVLKKEIGTYFTDLQKALADYDRPAIVKLIWGEGMLVCAENQGLVKLPRGIARRRFLEGFSRGFGQKADNIAASMGFDDHRLQLIEEIRDGEVIAYVRLWHADFQTFSKMRWWLIRDAEGGWRAYDYEDFDQNLRTSALVGVMITAAESDAAWVGPTMKLVQGMQELAMAGELQDGIENLQESVNGVLKTSAPDAVKSIAYTFRYSNLVQNGEFEDALAALQKMEEIDSKSPIVLYGRGVCYVGLEQHGRAIEAFTTYAERLGWDADVCDLVSFAHFGKGDTESAVKFAKRGLADVPESVDCLIDLALALPGERIGEFAGYASKMEDPEAAYEMTLDYLLQEGYDDQAETVYKLLKEQFQESELIDAYKPDFEGIDLESAT